LGGRPKRTARFALAGGILFKLLAFIATDPFFVAPVPAAHHELMTNWSACKQNETVSFLLTVDLGRINQGIETVPFRFI
jgi:hypothetical protein